MEPLGQEHLAVAAGPPAGSSPWSAEAGKAAGLLQGGSEGEHSQCHLS